MESQTASRTALVTALMRARHSRLDPQPLFDDRWADVLVPPIVRERLREFALAGMDASARAAALAEPASIVDDYLRGVAAYANVILRTAYTEQALARAVSAGTSQYVLIGAGFDTYALRRPASAGKLQVFEVDHPATQELKLQRMAANGVRRPDDTHYVAADLAVQDLGAVLAEASFRTDQPAFFALLGVTMYLTRASNDALLRAVARCAPAGSELVFTYLDARTLDARVSAGPQASLRERVASVGEPFLSGWEPDELDAQLRDAGLTLLEDLDGTALAARCDPAGVNGLSSTRSSHLARACVGAPRASRRP